MQPIFVLGHRNPDTDSIVSAMAYAALRNQLGDGHFVDGRLGPLNDETSMLLRRFEMEPPMLISSVRTQVRDLFFDTPPAIGERASLGHAWQLFEQHQQVGALPIVNEDGTLYGVLSHSDITSYDITTISHPVVTDVPVFNLLGVLEGQMVPGCTQEITEVSGEIIVALPVPRRELLHLGPDSIAICGDQPDVIAYAIESGVKCIIICGAPYPEELADACRDVLVITTSFDAYRTARLIPHAAPVGRICRRDNLTSFHLDDYLDDVRDVMLKNRHNAYPVLDHHDKVVGMLTRYQLIRPRRKRVVLVDHNEISQSVAGLEQAEIIEIIDHHRLADVQTGTPILMRNEPIGSTTSIVASIYQERGIAPSQKLAGLMTAAILSDTVMLKSPTCTDKDRRMAETMARIGRVNLDQLGHELFSASLYQEKPSRDLFFQDFKDFLFAGHRVGISQITCFDSELLMNRKDEFLTLMRALQEEKDYEMVLLMITDILREGTELLYTAHDEQIEQAFSLSGRDNHLFLQGVVSRKKQLVPAISSLWG